MKTILTFAIILSSLSAIASTSTMNLACETKIRSEIGPDGSVQSSTDEIIESLKLDWINNSKKATAHYDDCGASDYFYITVNKADCKITELDSGDSDGECN